MRIPSVIAITSYGGHAFDSWRSRISTTRPIDCPMWLCDFLPQRFPNARIMTYGYDSSLGKLYRADITDYRRGFIQCLRNCRRHCPVSLCLTNLPLTCLPFFCPAKKRPIAFIGHSLGGILVIQVGGHLLNLTRTQQPRTNANSYG